MNHIGTVIINIYAEPDRFKLIVDYPKTVSKEEFLGRFKAVRDKITPVYVSKVCPETEEKV